MTAFTAKDGKRTIQFDGVQLGHASSYTVGKLRWSEIVIYRTNGGSYIVAGVGRSQVPHEDDRYWANVVDTPDAVIHRLTMKDDHGISYIPRVPNRAVLEAAAVSDSGIAGSYGSERVA